MLLPPDFSYINENFSTSILCGIATSFSLLDFYYNVQDRQEMTNYSNPMFFFFFFRLLLFLTNHEDDEDVMTSFKRSLLNSWLLESN